jgi:tRNA/rRNA methyltransferase
MGLDCLVLVAPEADPADREARRRSTHGEEILRRVEVAPTLKEAIADCIYVAGTSARTGNLIRREFGWPEQVMPRLLTTLAWGPVALVFGPEPSGLTDEEIALCNDLICIPTDDSYPALNLAQAVAICLYELRRMWAKYNENIPAAEPPAAFADQDRMFQSLRAALEQVHFLYGPTADTLMHALRRLIVRAGPTEKEVKLLMGLARQLRWFASRHDEER